MREKPEFTYGQVKRCEEGVQESSPKNRQGEKGGKTRQKERILSRTRRDPGPVPFPGSAPAALPGRTGSGKVSAPDATCPPSTGGPSPRIVETVNGC